MKIYRHISEFHVDRRFAMITYVDKSSKHKYQLDSPENWRKVIGQVESYWQNKIETKRAPDKDCLGLIKERGDWKNTVV